MSLAPQPGFEHDPGDDLGPPTVTLRPARALKPADEPVHAAATVAPLAPAAAASTEEWENRFAWDKPRERKRASWMAAGALVLALLLTGQAIFHFRDAIAAHFPTTRAALVRACGYAGCAIRPLRDVAALSIEASDLQADAAHRGLLILAANVRNRANFAIAYPHLELTLTDAQDQPVVRRAFAPAEYAGGHGRRRARHPRAERVADQALHRRERDVAGGVPAVPVLSVTRRSQESRRMVIGRGAIDRRCNRLPVALCAVAPKWGEPSCVPARKLRIEHDEKAAFETVTYVSHADAFSGARPRRLRRSDVLPSEACRPCSSTRDRRQVGARRALECSIMGRRWARQVPGQRNCPAPQGFGASPPMA